MPDITNIMPMAGIGKRFKNSKFKLPKPLIKINNKPMFIEASKSMLLAEKNIFICNYKLEKKYKISEILKKKYLNKFKLITVKKATKGQANTCLIANKFLNEQNKIFIHSCDSLIKYNKSKLKLLISNSDAVILTTKPNKIHLSNIKSYGWVCIRNNKIKNISCKEKASINPKNDRVIVGSFAFKNKNVFSRMLKNLIKNKSKINNEYYIDMAFSLALNKNFKISNLSVKSYYSWGTPQEIYRWRNKIENSK